MATRASLFLIVIFLAKPLAPEDRDRFIVWNVGQGLWTTHIAADGCLHFDMGGEKAPWNKAMEFCRSKANFAHISHWDTDHLNFIGRAQYFLPSLCRLNIPPQSRSAKKEGLLRRLTPCAPSSQPYWSWETSTPTQSNDASVVTALKGVLIPGDSSQAAEKLWRHKIRDPKKIRVLVLGHHGSRTSTSEALLKTLPNLRQAIASARKRRYGHPHLEVERRLQRFRVPMITTEDWGNIHIWL